MSHLLDKYDKKRGKIVSLSQNAAKHAGFLDKYGRLTNHATHSASLRRNVTGPLKRGQRNFLKRGVNSLSRVRMQGPEIEMYLNTRTDARTSHYFPSADRSSRRRSLRHNPYGRAGGGRKLGYMGGKRTNIRRTNKSKRKSKRKVKR